MVPLPLHTQRIVAETVICRKDADRISRPNIRFCVGGIGLAVVTNYWPVVFPHYWLQVWHTPQSALVFLHDGPPLTAIGRIHKGTLVYGVNLPINIFFYEHLLLIGTEDVFRTEDCLSGWPSSIGGIDIVVITNLVEVTTFQSAFVLNDILLLDEVEVLVEFTHLDVSDTTCYVYLSVIEEHARVIVSTRYGFHLPFAFRVTGREHECTGIVAVQQDVELTIMILHRTSPHAPCIGILAIDERIVLLVGKLCEWLRTILPVHKIFRLHDGGTRQQVHRGTDHIISITNAYYIGVGEVGKDNWILITPISHVTLCSCYDSHHQGCPYEKYSFHLIMNTYLLDNFLTIYNLDGMTVS